MFSGVLAREPVPVVDLPAKHAWVPVAVQDDKGAAVRAITNSILRNTRIAF